MQLKTSNQITMSKNNSISSSNPPSSGTATQSTSSAGSAITSATNKASSNGHIESSIRDTSATNKASSNGHIESSIRDSRSTRTTFECHPDEILKAIGVVSGLFTSTQGNESSNPQEDSSLSSSPRYHSPTIVESVFAELPSSTPTVETNDNILDLIDDTILSRTGHTTRPWHRRSRHVKTRTVS